MNADLNVPPPDSRMRKSEKAAAVAKIALQLIPFGGALATLIDTFIPDATARSVKEGQEFFQQRLEEIEDRIDVDAVNKEEFSELFKLCMLVWHRTHKEEKIRAAASLLANALLKNGDSEKLSYTELDHFARGLESLSIGALKVLGTVSTIKGNRQKQPSVDFVFGHLYDMVPETDSELLMGLLGELNSFNLVRMKGWPGTVTEEYRNYPLAFTSLGRRFATHVFLHHS